MFDNRLLKIEAQATIENVVTDTSLLHATIEDLDISPSSPGMESILEEQRVARKAPSDKQKYNDALDVCTSIAETLNMYEKARFNKFLRATNDFLKLVRKGLDDDLIKYMSDPSEYLIVPKRQVERAAAVEIPNNETEAVL